MKKTVRLLAMVMTVCMLLNTAVFAADVETAAGSVSVDNVTEQTYESVQSNDAPEIGSYNEGVVLVKSEKALTLDMLAELDAVSAEPLYRGSVWYTVTLADTVTTAEAVVYLRELDCFDAVDYDYIMKADGEVESVDIAIYKLEEKFGEVVRGDIWCSEKYYFNKAGDVIESAYYDSDGSLGWKYIYKYDVSGNMIEWAEYKSDGSSDWKRIYKYDASGNRIERTEYRGEALLPDRQTVYEIIYRK